MSRSEQKIPNFLCDTWWFGVSKRMSSEKFEELAEIRAKQGFTAVQMVVGIPPEVGSTNLNAESPAGSAWSIDGEINQRYLVHARKRVQTLNSLGLIGIIYGAWGYQIEWLGVEGMKRWWEAIVKSVDDLNVIYCLTGESDLWVGEEDKLLPDRATREEKNGARF